MPAGEILKKVDWTRYEEEVFLAVEDAVRHYNAGAKGSNLETVSQISLTTSPQTRVTTIGFETLSHAVSLGSFVVRRPEDADPQIELTHYVSPEDFQFREYHAVYHPALLPLAELKLSIPEQEQPALRVIETHLLSVRDHLVLHDVLGRLPRAQTFWIGINSPRDWYDHVLRL
jgi:hypothetical protein